MAKYIDVESLRFPNICVFDMTLHGATVPMVRLVDLQKLVPAADVAPVRHGRWLPSGIPDSILDKCSECGFDTGAFTFRYCPNCGAKMDGGQEDV